jgi:hypothetical protein
VGDEEIVQVLLRRRDRSVTERSLTTCRSPPVGEQSRCVYMAQVMQSVSWLELYRGTRVPDIEAQPIAGQLVLLARAVTGGGGNDGQLADANLDRRAAR